MGVGSGRDPDLLRAVVDLANLLATRDEVLARPAVAAGTQKYRGETPEPLPGPSRAEFLRLLHA
jgi:hypothetical protein